MSQDEKGGDLFDQWVAMINGRTTGDVYSALINTVAAFVCMASKDRAESAPPSVAAAPLTCRECQCARVPT